MKQLASAGQVGGALALAPRLDGYCVEKGIIRQFVAMPLGEGYSVEEQLTGEPTWGGVQILVCFASPAHVTREGPPLAGFGLREALAACPSTPTSGARSAS